MKKNPSRTEGPLVQSSIRFRPDLKKRVDHACIERHVTLQSAINDALEQWVSRPSGAAHLPTLTVPQASEIPDLAAALARPDPDQLCRMLHKIMDKGYPEYVRAIAVNIIAVDLLASVAPHQAGH